MNKRKNKGNKTRAKRKGYKNEEKGMMHVLLFFNDAIKQNKFFRKIEKNTGYKNSVLSLKKTGPRSKKISREIIVGI